MCAHISETKMKGKGTARYENYIIVYSGKPKHTRAHSGVEILHDKYSDFTKDTAYVSDRILKVTLQLNTKILHLNEVYALDITKPKDAIDQFYTDLQSTLLITT